MRYRFPPVVILLAASLFVSAEGPIHSSVANATDPTGLVVHEWGTFTSVAGQDGFAEEWVPPQGPRDLPCFVGRLPSNIKGWMPATVRMETPVIYFYSPEDKTVDVRVRFRQGLITEWYPRAERDARQHPGAGAEESCARGNDRVEPGKGDAAYGGRLSGRERRESLLRGAQHGCVASTGWRPAREVPLLSRDWQLRAAARRHDGCGWPCARQRRAGNFSGRRDPVREPERVSGLSNCPQLRRAGCDRTADDGRAAVERARCARAHARRPRAVRQGGGRDGRDVARFVVRGWAASLLHRAAPLDR